MASNSHDGPPRAVVAVAASAGGVEALSHFVRSLPAQFPAAVLVVLHIPPTGPSVLPGILARAGVLPARHACDGDVLQEGVVLVAPPDHHLSVSAGVVRVTAGPREHGHRPSADVLMRSVAECCGKRGAGVVLSGTMDDGATGLRAIKSVGGFAIVQDPEEAAFPGMPEAAMEAAEPDLVCPAGSMGVRLVEWVEGLPEGCIGQEEEMAADDPEPDFGEVSEFTCPECGGTLWTYDDYGTRRFRCRVGHGFSEGSLMLGKQDALESALWAAIVALEEKADLSHRIAERIGKSGRSSQLARYESEIESSREQAEMLKQIVEQLISAEHEYEGGNPGAGTGS